MAMLNRWGEQNRLIRRVRQHGAVATFFRSPDRTPMAAPRTELILGAVPSQAPSQTTSWVENADAAPVIQTAWKNPDETPVASGSTPLGYEAQQPLPHVPAAQRTSLQQPVTGARTTSVVQAQSAIPAAFPARAVTSSLHPGEGVRPASLATGRAVEAAQSDQSMFTQPTLVQPAPRPVTQQAPIQRAPQQPLPVATPVERVTTEQNQPTTQQNRAPALPQAAATVQRQPQPAARPLEVAPSTSGQDLDEPTWSRLQAIYRAHKLREAAEANPSVTSPTPTTQPSAPPVQRAENSRSSMPVPTQPTPTPQTSTTAASVPDKRAESSVIERASSPVSTAAPVTPHTVTPHTVTEPPSVDVSQARIAPNQPIAEPIVSAVTQESDSPEEVQLVTPPKPLPEASAVQRADITPMRQALGAPSEIKRPARQGPDVSSAALPEPVYEAPTATPLQAVWPVQRVATPTGTDDFVLKAEVETLPPVEASIPAHERAEVRRRVETIQANQPTESRIDIVTPRRPRPVRQAQPTITETTNAQPTVEAASPVLQRQREGQTEPSTPASAAPMSTQIDTEIGPLPADLWRLIGEQPPVTPEGGAATQQSTQDTGATAHIQRARLPSVGPLGPPSPTVTDDNQVPPALAPVKAETTVSRETLLLPIVAQPAVTSMVQKASFTQPVATERSVARIHDEVTPVQALNAANRDETVLASEQMAPLVTAAAQITYSAGESPITPLPSFVEPENHSTSAPAVQRASEPGTTDPTIAALMNMARSEENEHSMESDAAMDVDASSEFAASATTVGTPQTAAKQRSRKRAGQSTTTAVQREDAEPDTVSSSAEDTTTQSAKPTGKAASAKIDTDELARQVYSKIKRKLTVERERLR